MQPAVAFDEIGDELSPFRIGGAREVALWFVDEDVLL
jgi:hypothetical protein